MRESVKQFRALVEGAPEAIFVQTEHRFAYLNPAAVRLFGAETADQLIGQPVLDRFHPSVRDQVQQRIHVLNQEKREVPILEEIYLRMDGSPVNVEVAAVPITYEGQDGALVFVRDITERQRAAEERARLTAEVYTQAKQMAQILATVPAGVLLLDATGRVLQANTVAEGDLAVLAGVTVGDTLTRLGDCPLADLLTSPPIKGLWHEIEVEARIFEALARPVENGPAPEQWVLVIKDVTEERQIRAQIQQQAQLAAVGQLAAGIAHDFNNIMAVVVLYTQMGLNMPDAPPKLRARLEVVSQQARRATDLIQQILDFGRQAVLERRPMDLVPFLKEVVKLLERTLPENIKVKLNYDRDAYTVDADPTRMQQAIMNLAINARDAMRPQEGGELRIDLSRIAAPDSIQCGCVGRCLMEIMEIMENGYVSR